MANTEEPQFALPFRLDANGREPLYVEQDSEEEVGSCIEVLLRTPLGSVEENTDLGITDPTFSEGDPDLNEIQAAISQWEGDRADTMIEQQPSVLDLWLRRVNIEVNVRSDGG